MKSATKNVTSFKGLNNVTDPLRLSAGWLTKADNIDITDTKGIERRQGYARAATLAQVTGAYSTRDYARMYLVSNGQLLRVYPDMTTAVLADGLGSGAFYADEVNQQVYWSTGFARGIIMPDDTVREWAVPVPPAQLELRAVSGNMPAGLYRVTCTFISDDGRESGADDAAVILLEADSGLAIQNIPQLAGHTTAVYVCPADATSFYLAFTTNYTTEVFNASPDELGVELMTMLLNTPPDAGTQPTFFQGRMHLMEYYPSQNMTTVWMSEPLGYHLYNPDENFISVPGHGLMLAAVDGLMVIGTATHIYGWDGETLAVLADYGVVPGRQWAVDRGENDEQAARLLFWTLRGLCAAPPFSNLTLRQISVDSGASAGAAIIRKNGAKKFVVALQKGGESFNPRT